MSQQNTTSTVIAMPGDEKLAAALAERLGARAVPTAREGHGRVP